MIDFESTFPVAENYGFKFIDQRTVLYKMASSGFVYYLTKHDVIDAINYFISEIHRLTTFPIRGEGMNYKAFKMFDLVPFLYTLINLYLTKRASLIIRYHRWLPELKLTRFCHLPFDEEIFEPEKEDLEINVFIMQDLNGKNLYVCPLYGVVESAYSFQGLKSRAFERFPLLKRYNVLFVVPN